MIQLADKTKCNGCHACFSICPTSSIVMEADNEGFLYPAINHRTCILCRKCEKVCPVLSHSTADANSLQISYAAYNKCEEERKTSSSGGIFTLLAKAILASGGVVIGVTMDNDNTGVHHVIINSIEGIDSLRGSKYTQSTIGDVFIKTELFLKEGRIVLFTGTPCQIGGMCSYLGKNYDNLYTQDLICHGVPSPLIWKKYVDFREASANSSVDRIMFRNKDRSWKNYDIVFNFADKKVYRKSFVDDAFMRGFLHDLYLRPSCYNCSYRGRYRQSDLTLADFWGIQNILPEMDDDQGTSFVWIHTEKGKALFEQIQKSIEYREVSCDDALKYNPSAVSDARIPANREAVFSRISADNFEEIIAKCTRRSLFARIYSAARKIKHTILKEK